MSQLLPWHTYTLLGVVCPSPQCMHPLRALLRRTTAHMLFGSVNSQHALADAPHGSALVSLVQAAWMPSMDGCQLWPKGCGKLYVFFNYVLAL